MDKKRMFIIDVMAMVFRNYHAFGAVGLTNSNGLPTSAIFGSAKFLFKLITEERPDYLVFATDMKTKTFRHDLYPDYKANRSEMPEELAVQLPYVFELFETIGCPTLKSAGVEADDIIGSVVRKFQSDQLHCYIVSGDKDFMQLVNDSVFLYVPKKGGKNQIVTIKEVLERFQSPPDRVIDVLALMGDASDNVPGVAGIGEKGACNLVKIYGSLDEIYKKIERITNKRQKNSLEFGREMALVSRQLVTIKTDHEIPYELADFICHPENILASRELLDLMEKLEFRQLAEIVTKNIAANNDIVREHALESGGEKTHESHDLAGANYRLVNCRSSFLELLASLENAKQFSFDTETTGLDLIDSFPIGISFSLNSGTGCYLPLVQKDLKDIDASEIKEKLALLLTKAGKLKVGHNIKFDLQMLRNISIEVQGPFADTMIMAHLLESNLRSYNLDACCLRYLNYTKIPITSLMGEGGAKSMIDVDISSLTTYAAEDADLTLRLYETLLPQIHDKELYTLFEKVEMPLIPVLSRMEQAGIFLDTDTLHGLSLSLNDSIVQLTEDIFSLAGERFNINSTKQLQHILFEKLRIQDQLGIRRIKKTKSGFSTDYTVLDQLSEHPLPQKLLQFRTITKLKNTYVDTLPQLVHPRTRRVHTTFHQTGTATGRLSSSHPNLQNIPVRSELGKEIRKSFRAETDEYAVFAADYSQIELRLLAHMTDEKQLIEAFKAGSDIHLLTASKILNIEPEHVTPEQRNQAKAINFGIIYGMGAQRLAKEINVSLQDAKLFIEKYFETYPGIRDYMSQSVDFAKANEYTKTLLGRRRPLPEINGENKLAIVNAQNIAINSPVQGSAADLIKMAMINVQKELDKADLGVRMLLQVHDELVFECPKATLGQAMDLVKHTMEHALEMTVPLIVDVGYGANWLDAH